MPPSWNPDILDRYVAPGISTFTAAAIPDLVVEGEKFEHWMANHFLNSVFRAAYSGKQRQFAFNIIYRAQACFESYGDASGVTKQCLAEGTPDNPRTRLYYRALRHWEACFLHLQRGVAIFAKAFLGILAQQAAKITRPLLPSAAPAVLLHSLHTQQGVCNIVTQ